jgi:hypothetical protein
LIKINDHTDTGCTSLRLLFLFSVSPSGSFIRIKGHLCTFLIAESAPASSYST